MSDSTDHGALMKRALQEIKSLRSELAEARASQREPIAIVGMACRFPGANSPEAFWELLRSGTDAITEVPRSRWNIDDVYDADPDAPGKMYTRYGGFLEGIDQFDAQFFGVSPLDAMNMDPQQRLLLEVAWEALENAGQVPGEIARTGVYVGSFMDDYLQLNFQAAHPRDIDAYNTLGLLRGLAAGRLAYALDLHGPAMQLDTACSSSLLAAHLACQALRNRECDLALAGGVNLILVPEVTIGLCRMKAIAADGRCKSFDARADGYVRGEGCGIVVLRRLSDALAAGDAIYAVIRGSAVNHDGRSNGLTAPNGTAQKTVIRDALADAGIDASAIQFVEAHGTGTSLGDPIEAIALGEVLCPGRSEEERLLIGSVKSNFGHLESAAGAAALMKVALSLHHGAIPPSLHFEEPNPHIPWERLPISVPTKLERWRGEGKHAAGISSFGMSGTNVHMIVEEAPPASVHASDGFHALTLSAQTPEALRALMEKYAGFLDGADDALLRDLCCTSNQARRHFDHRVAVVADTVKDLAAKLNALPQFEGTREGRRRPRIAFVFSGDGSDNAEVRDALYRQAPAFRDAMDACSAILRSLQPSMATSLFAFEYALARLWMSWGIVPDAVLGEGVGEFVAACIAGVLRLEDVLPLVAGREQNEELDAKIVLRSPSMTFISAATGDVASKDLTQLAYWRRTETAEPRFAEGMRKLRELDHRIVIEIGPHARLGVRARHADDVTVLPSAREGRGAMQQLLESLAVLYEKGFNPDWVAVEGKAAKVALPVYPFQRQHFWVPRRAKRRDERAGRFHFEWPLRADSDWKDHRLENGTIVVPAAAYVAMLRESAPDVTGLRDVTFPSPFTLNAGEERTLHLVRTPRGEFTLVSQASEGEAWTEHASGNVEQGSPVAPRIAFEELAARHGGEVTPEGLNAGFVIGPTFQWTQSVRRGENEVLCRMRSAERFSPGLIDSCLRTLALCATGVSRDAGEIQVPFHIESLHFYGVPTSSAALWCHASLSQEGSDRLAGDIRLFDASGLVLMEVRGLETRSVPLSRLRGDGLLRDALLEVEWIPAPSGDRVEVGSDDVVFSCEGDDAGSRLLALLKTLDERRTLWLVTRDTQAALPGDRIDPAYSWIWGFGRTLAVERPGLRCIRVDLDASSTLQSIPAGEDQVALRNGVAYVPRLARKSLQPSTNRTPLFDASETYLLTGAFGALGSRVARWMVDEGARKLVLVGRNARDVAELEARGATVRTFSIDLADAEAAARLFEAIGSIRGIFHAAGVLDDALLGELTWERFERVFAPKVRGAWNLHAQSLGHDLEFFVCFSSIAAMIGSSGQANYAAANSFMDALAHHRRSLGLPGLSINWSAWGESGMAAAMQDRLRTMGIAPIAPAAGLELFGHLLRSGATQIGVLPADWSKLLPAVFAEAPRMFANLGVVPAEQKRGAMALLQRTSAEERRKGLALHIRERIVSVMGRDPFPAHDVSAEDISFFELGMDSLMSLDLRNRLQSDLDLTLPSTVAFEYPTIPHLVDYLIATAPQLDATS